MADLPAHPGSQDPEHRPAARRLRATVIVVIAVCVLAAMIILHVTGVVGAGTNG